MSLSIIHHFGEPNSAFSRKPFYIFQKQLQNISKIKNKEKVAKLVKYIVIFQNSNLKRCYFLPCLTQLYLCWLRNQQMHIICRVRVLY